MTGFDNIFFFRGRKRAVSFAIFCLLDSCEDWGNIAFATFVVISRQMLAFRGEFRALGGHFARQNDGRARNDRDSFTQRCLRDSYPCEGTEFGGLSKDQWMQPVFRDRLK